MRADAEDQRITSAHGRQHADVRRGQFDQHAVDVLRQTEVGAGVHWVCVV